jgi:crotonobetaine/carnitine-CoA ligase
MEYFAGHCGAVAAITQPAYAELISANCRGLRWIAVISHDAGAKPAQGAPRGDSFEHCSPTAPTGRAAPPIRFAPCSVQYTSGTTSRPKAVLWTHANALWGAKINAAHEDLHAATCTRPICRCFTPTRWPIRCWRRCGSALPA